MKSSRLQFESLHNHTLDSDGDLTHLQILNVAEKNGIGTIAFTEHDSLPSAETLKQLKSYQGPVHWFIGIELTSAAPGKYNRKGSFHMLGYFTDPTNKALLEHCHAMAEGRLDRMRHFVAHLQSLGFKISEQDCLEVAGNAPIGSPHMVKAIYKHPENEAIIERMRGELKAKAKTDQQLALKYKEMLADRPNLHPYFLFMKRSSLYPMPHAGEGAMLDLDGSAKLIRDSGGMPIMAHWFYNKDVIRESELEELLKTGRLDGIESDVKNSISQVDHTAESIWLSNLAKRYNAVEVVSADAHHVADFERFARSDLAERSIGQTAKIIERQKPNLDWSNLK